VEDKMFDIVCCEVDCDVVDEVIPVVIDDVVCSVEYDVPFSVEVVVVWFSCFTVVDSLDVVGGKVVVGTLLDDPAVVCSNEVVVNVDCVPFEVTDEAEVAEEVDCVVGELELNFAVVPFVVTVDKVVVTGED
jgi:hypothetical protein